MIQALGALTFLTLPALAECPQQHATIGANCVDQRVFNPGVPFQTQTIDVSSQPVIISTKTADQSISQNVATNVLFDFNVRMAGITHANVGGSTITFTSSGTYIVICGLQWAANATGSRQITLVVNNSATIANVKVPTAASGLAPMQAAALWYFSVGDTLVCRGTQDGASSLAVRGGVSAATFLSVGKLW